MEIVARMPLATYERAKKLLKQRGCLRPPETLPLLAEMFLRWQGAIGVPEPIQAGWDPMLRDFRAVAFDLSSTPSQPWTEAQSIAAHDLLIELWQNNLDAPPLQLPAWESQLEETSRDLLAIWTWTHLDCHYLALTMGILSSGLMEEEPRFSKDREWMRSAQEQIALLSNFAEALTQPRNPRRDTGKDIAEELAAASGMLDGLATHITMGLNKGGLQSHLMARAACWHHPSYPVTLDAFIKQMDAQRAPRKRAKRP
jgi:hypothetical protein